jgi:hypothetical protein
MPDLQNQGKIAGIFTLTIPESLNQNIIISAGFKTCDKSFAWLWLLICCEEQTNLFFCFHLSLSIGLKIIFRLQKNRIATLVCGFLFD